MKNLIPACAAAIAISLLPSCSSKKSEKASSGSDASTTDIEATYAVVEAPVQPDMPLYVGGKFLNVDSLPRHPNYDDIDIDSLSYQELRLLRNYPYACHGMWFLDADLNKFYNAKAYWYYSHCEDMTSKNNWEEILSYDQVKLSSKEQAFVDRIDRRMAELLKQIGHKPGEPIPVSVLSCANMFQIDDPDPQLLSTLHKWNVAFVPSNKEQLFNIYEINDYQMVPSLVTTDLFLQAYHMYFSYVLKSLEGGSFIPRLQQGVRAMNAEALRQHESLPAGKEKERAAFAADYFAIADALLSPKGKAKAKGVHDAIVDDELAKIMAEEDVASKFLNIAYFPYGLFKPRGHYTRNQLSQKYFRAMMWLQMACWCVDDPEQQAKAVYMASLLNRVPEATRKQFTDVFDALTFLMGHADNTSVIEIADYMRSAGLDPAKEKDMRRISGHIEKLASRHGKITPKLAMTCPDKINFMPQRYSIDGDILNVMADPRPNAEKAYPKGVDVFSILGFDAAKAVADTCYREAAKWKGYKASADSLRSIFENYDGWNASMYDKWMDCLLFLQNKDKNYPAFMTTSAWDAKNLNSALASWATLKHDAILYCKQPWMAECGDGGLTPPSIQGYIEPNVAFWQKMLDMLALNKKMLSSADLLNDDLKGLTQSIEEKVKFCLDMSKKELAGESLTVEEKRTIQYMGSAMEWLTLSMLDPDVKPDNWGFVSGVDRRVAVVADVYTRNIDGCGKSGILYEAIGAPQMVYALINVDGLVYLMRGAVYSYHEFVRPLDDRLTDEMWQQMINDGQRPGSPSWMKPYTIESKPIVNEEIFYSSGC